MDTIDAVRAKTSTTIFKTQVGGDHYTRMVIQPLEYVIANGLGFVEGCVIKYVSRRPFKGGLQDLKKAYHMLGVLIASLEAQEKDGSA